MTGSEFITRLTELYHQCSNRGWCVLKTYQNKQFITVQSSDLNFTHISPIYYPLPKRSLVSPSLSRKNLWKLDKLRTSMDSSRLLCFGRTSYGFKFKLLSQNGRKLMTVRLRVYTMLWSDRLGGFRFKGRS